MTTFSDLNCAAKRALLWLLVLALQGLAFTAHAQGCPAGTYPWSGNGVFTCLPDPNYQQPNQQQPQASQTMKWADRWEALATDADTGTLGTSSGMASRSSAEKQALKDCKAKGGSNCKIQISNANGCMAMVLGDNLFNVQDGSSESEAIEKSMKECKSADKNCKVYYSNCSPPELVR